eukprot:763227-Hanusia_phi.AAC.3
MGRIFLMFPQLLSYSLENNIKPKVIEDGLECGYIESRVKRYPSIFANSIDNHLMPLMDFLLIDIGVEASRLKVVILSFRTVFFLASLTKSCSFGFSSASLLHSLLASPPSNSLLLLSFAHSPQSHLITLHFHLSIVGTESSQQYLVTPITNYFTKELKIARNDFAKSEPKRAEVRSVSDVEDAVIERCPWILCMKIQTIESKIDLLTEEIGFTKVSVRASDVAAVVVTLFGG